MSTPHISVDIGPTKGNHVVFEPIAGKDVNAPGLGVLTLVLSITNLADPGHPDIHLTKVTVAFPGSSVATAKIALPAGSDPAAGPGLPIASGTSRGWNFEREDTIILPMPAPDSLELGLRFDGFSQPWTKTVALAPHRSPVEGGGYFFPAHFDDLRPDEFWVATSNTHGTGGGGNQLYAYDMDVRGWDPDSNAYSWLRLGKDGSKNEHYRIWGKKLYAMADGLVLQAIDDIPNNPLPIGFYDDGKEGTYGALDKKQHDEVWGPYDTAHDPNGADKVCAGNGNHVFIQYGDEVSLYAHMQQGSLNPALTNLPPGTPQPIKVKAGDFIGLAGNSGESSGPHLHVHVTAAQIDPPAPLTSIAACANGASRPLLWRDAFAVDSADVSPPDPSGPWVRLRNQGPPLGEADPNTPLIWPLGRHPAWNGWEDLGASITSAPAVTAWSPDRLDVFAARNDGQLAHRTWDGAHWSHWESLGGFFKGGPAAVSRQFERIDVFVRDKNDHILHRLWDGGAWHDWQDLGGGFTSAPAVASMRPNRLDLFAAGSDGTLLHRGWNGSAWDGGWDELGGKCKGAPSAVSWGNDRIDVVVRRDDDRLWHTMFDGQWHSWEDLGGKLGSAPAICSWGLNRLDVFAADADGEMAHKWFNGSEWTEWDGIGGSFKEHPAAVSWGPERLDVFVCGDDAHLGHLWRG